MARRVGGAVDEGAEPRDVLRELPVHHVGAVPVKRRRGGVGKVPVAVAVPEDEFSRAERYPTTETGARLLRCGRVVDTGHRGLGESVREPEVLV